MNTIVVGVDGSDGARAALRFALEEARLRGMGLKIVKAWHVPLGAYESGWAPIPINATDYEQLSSAALEQILKSVDAAASGVEVTRVVREGQAADVLIAEAKDAALLVVGSRGLGGFRGLLLGSISAQCAHHASCPLVIVPLPAAD